MEENAEKGNEEKEKLLKKEMGKNAKEQKKTKEKWRRRRRGT